MKRKNQDALAKALAKNAAAAALANAAGSVAPRTPSPEGPASAGEAPKATPEWGAEALVGAVLQVAGEVKALREAMVQVGFAVTAGLQPPAIAAVQEKKPEPKPEPEPKKEAEVKTVTIQAARAAVLAYAAKFGAEQAGALLRERVGAAKVSDLKTPEQFARVVEVFTEGRS